jgi:hypothetical protein
LLAINQNSESNLDLNFHILLNNAINLQKLE